MKKWLAFALVLTLTLAVMVGCTGGSKTSFKDGTYSEESEVDENGYKGSISITVKDGKISEVDYDELNQAGEKKSEDEAYAALMESVSGAKPATSYEQLENSLVKSQDPDAVDLVTGATGSSEIFKDLAKKALDKAK